MFWVYFPYFQQSFLGTLFRGLTMCSCTCTSNNHIPTGSCNSVSCILLQIVSHLGFLDSDWLCDRIDTSVWDPCRGKQVCCTAHVDCDINTTSLRRNFVVGQVQLRDFGLFRLERFGSWDFTLFSSTVQDNFKLLISQWSTCLRGTSAVFLLFFPVPTPKVRASNRGANQQIKHFWQIPGMALQTCYLTDIFGLLISKPQTPCH